MTEFRASEPPAPTEAGVTCYGMSPRTRGHDTLNARHPAPVEKRGVPRRASRGINVTGNPPICPQNTSRAKSFRGKTPLRPRGRRQLGRVLEQRQHLKALAFAAQHLLLLCQERRCKAWIVRDDVASVVDDVGQLDHLSVLRCTPRRRAAILMRALRLPVSASVSQYLPMVARCPRRVVQVGSGPRRSGQ